MTINVQPCDIKVVFSGFLCPANNMRMVFWSVMRRTNIGFGVLRISSPEAGIEGDIGIVSGMYVIGARLRGRTEKGYDAIKVLAKVEAGQFEFLDLTESYQTSLEDGVRLKLIDIMSKCPDLPEKADDLTCQKDSLVRLRAYKATPTQTQPPVNQAKMRGSLLQQFHRVERNSMRIRRAAFYSAFAVCSTLALIMWLYR